MSNITYQSIILKYSPQAYVIGYSNPKDSFSWWKEERKNKSTDLQESHPVADIRYILEIIWTISHELFVIYWDDWNPWYIVISNTLPREDLWLYTHLKGNHLSLYYEIQLEVIEQINWYK